jgi:hypothetical protein
VVHRVGIAPTSRAFQAHANLSQLPVDKMVVALGNDPSWPKDNSFTDCPRSLRVYATIIGVLGGIRTRKTCHLGAVRIPVPSHGHDGGDCR